MLGLIHLYCTDPHKALDAEDLEFAVAVAKQLGNAVHQLRRQQSLTASNRSLRDQLRGERAGRRQPGRQGRRVAGARVAGTNAACLIRGESGSGKELVARAIHYSSPRKEGPFVCLTCAAITETLLESELFGHEKGSFTGATEKKVGKFEAASHGTIFLDEIGEMATGAQAKLLRVLEGHPFERVGGGTPIKVDVRVVAATNMPLEQAVRAGTFRRDLFFRLQVVEIRVPPLRERPGDVPILAEHFLKRFVRETGRRSAASRRRRCGRWKSTTGRATSASCATWWSGPWRWAWVRRWTWVTSGFIAGDAGAVVGVGPPPYRPLPLEEVEKQHILGRSRDTDWNKSQAAAILDIERSTLDRKIKTYGLKR